MDNNFLKKFEDLSVKTENISLALDVIGQKKTNFSEEMRALASDVAEIREFENAIKESIKIHKSSITDDYNLSKQVVQNVTNKMFFILNEMDKERPKQRVLQELASPCPRLYDRADAADAFSHLNVNTPRMTISDYAKSPLIKKKSRAQLNFSDFEAEISKEGFEKIPSYIKGRTTLGELQDFLDNMVIKTFNGKYELVYKDRKVLRPTEFALQNMFKDQAGYCGGQKFITIGDLSRIMNKKVDKKDDRLLQCLRHLQIIREIRNQSTSCYIWTAK